MMFLGGLLRGWNGSAGMVCWEVPRVFGGKWMGHLMGFHS